MSLLYAYLIRGEGLSSFPPAAATLPDSLRRRRPKCPRAHWRINIGKRYGVLCLSGRELIGKEIDRPESSMEYSGLELFEERRHR